MPAARLAAFVLMLLASTAVRADDVADFYKGKEVRLIISASIGGGYDIYARAVARHLGTHIPGNPTIVPQNMPAAGGLGAANHLNNVAAKDGTVIALFQNTVPLEPFFENKQAQFDAAKIGWLGTPTTETALYMFWHSSKIRTLADAQRQEFVAGAAGAASTPAFYGRVFNQIFNFKARFITGYPGQNEILLALENGEVDGPAGTRRARFVFCSSMGRTRTLISRMCRLHSTFCKVRPTRRCWPRPAHRSGSAVRSGPHPAFRPTGSPPCVTP